MSERKRKNENMAYIERENVSHEFDMDSDIFCESPTSVWDDVEKEQEKTSSS